jgi:hypothetical protein
MSTRDALVLIGVGCFFILLGIISFLWAAREERGMKNVLSRRTDLRDFIDGWPIRVGPGSSRMVGFISIVIGTAALLLGAIFLAIH